jgi:hypothetical protein
VKADATRGWQQLLVVLALIAGVLGMHALVVAGHDRHIGVGDTGHHVMAEPATGPISTDHIATGHITVEPITAAAQMAADALMPAQAGHSRPTDVAHGLLHLCMAVLAAIALLLLGLFAVATPTAVAGRLLLRGPAPAPARPPPRSAVRLALLCVLRN